MHAQKLVEKGKDAAERRAYDLAIEMFMQAITLEPDHLEARRWLRSAELKKAEAYYPSAISRSIGSLGDRIAAWFAKLGKNHEKQMLALERALTKDPKNVKVGHKLAAAAELAGHRNAGIAIFEGILEVDSKDLAALRGLGRLLAITGEPKAALDTFERALAIDPRDQEANRMRKNLAAEVSITKTGVDRAQHSRDLMTDKEGQQELQQEARVIRGEDELREAATELEKLAADNPKDAKIRSELAARYAAIREYDKAIETYEQAFGLEPTNYMHREKAGDLRISRFDREIKAAQAAGDRNGAEDLKAERLEFMVGEFRARVHDHPTDLNLHFQLGRSLFETGDLDGAIGEFQQTIRDPRRKVESLTMLGQCFTQKGMFDLAENQLRKALEETPGMTDRTKEILYSLGRLKEAQESNVEALDEYKKIYEVDIQFRDVSERMAAIKQQIGEA
jgi:tetratricopeptide (TPR) repeat protein